MKFVVRLRPAFNNGPERQRIIEAESLREAQDKAFRRYGAHLVFGVERYGRRPMRPRTTTDPEGPDVGHKESGRLRGVSRSRMYGGG